MTGAGRRVAIVLISLAAILSAGRWVSLFLTERLWESSISEAVAVAGLRHALLALSLELVVLLLSAAWFVTHLTMAAHAALPDRAPPERPEARTWPGRVPRWSLLVAALFLGALLGSGAGSWLDHLLLTLGGVHFGVADPLLSVDLGFFLGSLPLWLEVQQLVLALAVAGVAAVVAIHLVGGAIGVADRRFWVSPKVRGHLSLLLAVLALALAWGAALEEYRLAAGRNGPMLPSEFLLRTLVAQIQAGTGAAAAVASFLWWVRVRGVAVFIVWVLFGVALLAGRVLPLGTVAAATDEGWRTAARRLDSVAYALADAEGVPLGLRATAAEIVPTLWDERMLPAALTVDSGTVVVAGRGWIAAGSRPRPVWFAVRTPRAQPPALLALADDEVSASGGALTWRAGDSTPTPGPSPYAAFPSHGVRPQSPAIDVSPDAKGVSLDGWPKRLILAWALQVPAALSAPAGSRLGWRLDPGARLRSIAPFARWSRPRVRMSAGGVVWTSDGLLTSTLMPSSARIEWKGTTVSMVRPAFLGMVDAATGGVRLFRRSSGDSLSAAWARIAAPLIESADAIPADLRTGDPYPEELLLAQARALSGPAWRGGQLDRGDDGGDLLAPAAPGGAEALVPLIQEATHRLSAFLLVRRTPAGDSVRFIRVDTAQALENAGALVQRWERFPFQMTLRDSVRATGGRFESGEIRRAIVKDGILAYQPLWAISSTGRAQLVMVNVMLGRSPGTGRTLAEAWKNLRGQMAPVTTGAGSDAVLEMARRYMRQADSALQRGDLQELGRALAYLRDLLEAGAAPPKPPKA